MPVSALSVLEEQPELSGRADCPSSQSGSSSIAARDALCKLNTAPGGPSDNKLLMRSSSSLPSYESLSDANTSTAMCPPSLARQRCSVDG